MIARLFTMLLKRRHLGYMEHSEVHEESYDSGN